MRNNAYTHLSRSIGYAIEKVMLKAIDPDDPGVQSWEIRGRVLGKVGMCFAPSWQTSTLLFTDADKKTLMNWAGNLDELGEWNGNRLTAMQEYEVSPENFAVNPTECEKLLGLGDEDMLSLVEGQKSTSELLTR